MQGLLPDQDSYLFYLFLFLGFCFIVQMAFYWIIFSRIYRYRDPDPATREPGVSVIICAHNEYLNLQEKLPLILTQDYPEYEVIVVNHASDDDTSFLLTSLGDLYPRLKIIEIREDLNFFSGKKFPLSIGIRSAKYELVLLTDADCRPSGTGWIRSMASAFQPATEITLGYGPFERRGGLVNKMIRFDAAHVAVQYLSFAMAGIPYMGVGRNLAYKKSLFYRNNGFISHYTIPSGDDDLFINMVATKSNTAVMLNPGSFAYSEPKRTLGKWITQKKRHFSTSMYYRFIHKLLLGAYSLSTIFFWAMLITLLIVKYAWISVLVILLLRIVSQVVLFTKWFRKLNEKDIIFFLPLLELLMLIMNGGIVLSNLFMKPRKWK
jgi:cellulose synthase/poly-beta-1,6-N-acetylglucosamine synthase-like glycosyltransferase